MFVPLKDDNPLRVIPFEIVNTGFIAIAIIVFVVFQSGLIFTPDPEQLFYAVIPAVLTEAAELPPGAVAIPEELTLVTYVFMHGGWLHLIGNMLFLWVFGDNIEDAMGHLKYLVFFLLCGTAAGYAHTLASPASETPLVGASGAVSGVVGSYLILHPRVKVWILILWRIPLKIPAFLALGFWILMQFASVAVSTPDDEVAWWAHIGGLAAGMVLTPFFKRSDVPLFDRGVSH